MTTQNSFGDLSDETFQLIGSFLSPPQVYNLVMSCSNPFFARKLTGSLIQPSLTRQLDHILQDSRYRTYRSSRPGAKEDDRSFLTIDRLFPNGAERDAAGQPQASSLLSASRPSNEL